MLSPKPKEHIIYERIRAPVKFFSRDKGYGFCKRTGKMDVFFTHKELEKSGIPYVKEHDLLEFDLVPVTGKGGRATKIKLVR